MTIDIHPTWPAVVDREDALDLGDIPALVRPGSWYGDDVYDELPALVQPAPVRDPALGDPPQWPHTPWRPCQADLDVTPVNPETLGIDDDPVARAVQYLADLDLTTEQRELVRNYMRSE